MFGRVLAQVEEGHHTDGGQFHQSAVEPEFDDVVQVDHCGGILTFSSQTQEELLDIIFI